MTESKTHNIYNPLKTARLVFSDGSALEGVGFGAQGTAVGEVCFNTAMTGYQETLTDPSYASQIITFTFPHIGNVGANDEDHEAEKPFAKGLIVREAVTNPSSWRAQSHFNDWLIKNNLIGISGIDTRALTQKIRDTGAPNAVIAHNADGKFDLSALQKQAGQWPGLEGMDLAIDVSCKKPYVWTEKLYAYGQGYVQQDSPTHHVVAIDYGIKRNILRSLASAGCKVTVVPCDVPAKDILALKPDGVFLSNGPGDPAATGTYAVSIIRDLMDSGVPLFGICLGHQILALALGGKTIKMHLGHRGANQPVFDSQSGKVEITSQNHGFVVLADSLPKGVMATHNSLFDKTNEGLRVEGKPIFSVQYHPEASPGPQDSQYLFRQFVDTMQQKREAA